MKMILTFTFLLYFFMNCLLSYSQTIKKDTIYVDEKNKLSERVLTLKKCSSDVFYCDLIEYDSIIAYHVRNKIFFGKMQMAKRDSLVNALEDRMAIELPESSTIIIDYRKYLFNYYNQKNYMDTVKLNEKYFVDERRFIKSKKHYLSGRKKCVKKINKFTEAKVIHLYSHNYGSMTENQSNLFWVKDYNNFFENNFFNEKTKYKYLIVKPNGNYFLKTYLNIQNDFSETDVFKLLKQEDWSDYIKEWESRKKLLKESVPKTRVFYDSYYSEQNCF